MTPPCASGFYRGSGLVVERKAAIASQRVACQGQVGACPREDAIQLAGGDRAVADADVGAFQGEARLCELDGSVFQAAAAAWPEGQPQPVAG